MCRDLVEAFFARARADPALSSFFNGAIGERWDAHLAKLTDFRSSVVLMTGRFKGSPMAVPAALPRAPVGVMIARHNMVDQLRQTGRGRSARLRYHQTAADWIATRLGERKASFFEHHQSSFPRTVGAWSPLCIEPGRATA